MKARNMLISLALALALAAPAGAYDISKIAAETLPESFTFKAGTEDRVFTYPGGSTTYRIGQLSAKNRRNTRFSSGWLITAELPKEGAEKLKPYFKNNLTGSEWRGLISLNRALGNKDSNFRKNLDTVLRDWAKEFMPDVTSEAKTDIIEIEPYRRLSADEAWLYTAGGKIIFDTDRIIQPLYARAYFFRDGDHLDLLMLVAPDEGKGPLVYAVNDLAARAAKETFEKAEDEERLEVLLGTSGKVKSEK